MEFDQAVERLTARGPGRMIPDLSRIISLAELLGDPQTTYPSVHVTGTNGKTSISRMVTTLCSAVGLQAGTYTSPHLQTVRERLSIAGRMITKRDFADLYGEIAPLADLVDEQLEDPRDHVTYFEMLTAMAYWWFAERAVDVGVFEVGMGGRWDATNLVRGDVAVLSTIDVDHRELGSTPLETAEEKLGIVKDGSHVVCADQAIDVMDRVRETAADRAASLTVLGEDLEVVDRKLAVGGQQFTLRIGDRVIEDISLPLFGAHQAGNAALALGALALLSGDSFEAFDDELIRHGFLAVSVPGRLEVVDTAPSVVLDGAHNPHGSAVAARAVDEAFDFRTLVLVVGVLADKDVPGVLEPWKELADHVVVTRPPSPRALPIDRIAAAAEEVWAGTPVIIERADTVEDAVEKATGVAAPGDGVLVTGSLHTVGAVRAMFRSVPEDPPIPEVEVDGEARTRDELDAEERAFQEAIDEMIDRLDSEDPGPS